MATIIYYGDFQHYGYCENWIAAALDRNGHSCVRLQRRPNFSAGRILDIAKETKATILLLSKAPEINANDLAQIRGVGVKVVFWTFDWMRNPGYWPWYGPLAEQADICFQTDGYGEAEIYKSYDIRRVELHQGCEPGLHDMPRFIGPLIQKIAPLYAHDVTFIGSSYSPRRDELVKQLARYDFKKWGDPDPVIWGREFATACYASKIVVGDNFVNHVAGYWSDRVYLTLACGGFFLTAYVEGIDKEFENHRHLVWWRDYDELHRHIDYYLPREAERRAIALEGYRLVHREHTYDQRIEKFTEELKKL